MAGNSHDAAHHRIHPLKNASAPTLRTTAELAAAGLINDGTDADLIKVAQSFAVAVTPQMVALIDTENVTDPCAAQFVPAAAELTTLPEELDDPIGDQRHSPVTGIVHRYPDRLLLTPVRICAVYCRFCFRREAVGSNADAMLTTAELEQAFNYIRTHEEIWEVILSGGDPLVMSPRRLADIVATLEAIPHVKVIRVHTRVPVVDPTRITPELVAALKSSKACYVVLHTNHAQEMSAAARHACALLVDSGIPMLSQSVLLRGVNDDAATLEKLMRTLVENRIKPYYLHHADRARGTAHFRTSIREGQALVNALRGRVSGLCQPDYVLDIPGGAGKTPVAAAWIEPTDAATYKVRDYTGNVHQYTDSAAKPLD